MWRPCGRSVVRAVPPSRPALHPIADEVNSLPCQSGSRTSSACPNSCAGSARDALPAVRRDRIGGEGSGDGLIQPPLQARPDAGPRHLGTAERNAWTSPCRGHPTHCPELQARPCAWAVAYSLMESLHWAASSSSLTLLACVMGIYQPVLRVVVDRPGTVRSGWSSRLATEPINGLATSLTQKPGATQALDCVVASRIVPSCIACPDRCADALAGQYVPSHSTQATSPPGSSSTRWPPPRAAPPSRSARSTAHIQTRAAPLAVLVDGLDEALASQGAVWRTDHPTHRPRTSPAAAPVDGRETAHHPPLARDPTVMDLDDERCCDPVAVRAYARKLLSVPGSSLAGPQVSPAPRR